MAKGIALLIRVLKAYFFLVLAAMLWVTWRASQDRGVMQAFVEIAADPWGLATLFDAYLAFLTFYLWLAYKEVSPLARVSWLLAILLLGNFAMAGYVLIQLFRLPRGASMEELLLRRKGR